LLSVVAARGLNFAESTVNAEQAGWVVYVEDRCNLVRPLQHRRLVDPDEGRLGIQVGSVDLSAKTAKKTFRVSDTTLRRTLKQQMDHTIINHKHCSKTKQTYPRNQVLLLPLKKLSS
jgi:hypothetical protein